MGVTINFIQPNGELKAVTTEDLGRTVMEVAREAGVQGIAADCGGACACATCHVHVDAEWFDVVGPPSPVEADMLDLSAEPGETSRLSCQIGLRPELDGLKLTVAEN